MTRPRRSWGVPRGFRIAGRIGFAFAAGGAFAVLAWEPSPRSENAADPNKKLNDPYSAERQGIVTEDDASPQFAAFVADSAEARQRSPAEDAWTNKPSAAGVQEPASAVETASGDSSPTSHTRAGKTVSTAVVKPRAPPQ